MARFSNNEINDIKRTVSIVALAEAAGLTLTKRGADFFASCPFHEDDEPSLSITPAKNLWRCFGCQTGGSVIDWVMAFEKVSFRHAVEKLRARNGDSSQDGPTLALPPALVEPSLEDQQLLKQTVDFYNATLKDSPEALAYLDSRGLRSAEAIEHFKLGYANRTLGYRLPPKRKKEGRELRKRFQSLGLLRKTGHEHFRGSLVIPVLDERGQVLEIYGRKIRKGLRKGTPLHLYLPGPHRGVWNLAAFAASDEIILCESLIDALSFWCSGFRNVTASYGADGFTEAHLAAFQAHDIRRVLIAYDRDAAGDRAADALAPRLLKAGIECARVPFPKGMDANEFALRAESAEESFGLALRKAVSLGKPTQTNAPAPRQDPADLSLLAADSTPTHPSPPQPSTPTPTEPPKPTPRPQSGVTPELRDKEVILKFGDRRYRVRGLDRNLSYDQLKVNLLVSRGEAFHVDTFDLYAARQRNTFVREASKELELDAAQLKKDIGRLLLALEEIQDEAIQAALNPQKPVIELTEEETAEALALLKDPRFLSRVLEDFESCGMVGEQTNKLVGYLAATSRKLSSPLAVIVQSSSAAGKSALMDAILAFMPKEEQVKYSAMTGQSLFYMGDQDLQHKILAIVEEEGATRASYALKLLQSEKELSIASTGKDPHSGRLVTSEYRVEGPVMILLTTTAIDLDEELLNRCLILSVDEDRLQTEAIHELQRRRRTVEGLAADSSSEELMALHRNAQRLLKPLKVANSYARRLTFRSDQTRARRDHEKYLNLIDAIALLHQHQRPIRSLRTKSGKSVDYVEVSLADIAIANALAHEVMGRSLDELPPQTGRLLRLIDEMVSAACERDEVERSFFRFTRRAVREYTGWGQTQLKLHLDRLEDFEFLLAHRGGRGQTFLYELAYKVSPGDRRRALVGLFDVEQLARESGYDGDLSGLLGDLSGLLGKLSPPNRGQIAPKSPRNRPSESAAKPGSKRPRSRLGGREFGTAVLGALENAVSCHTAGSNGRGS